MRCGVMAEPVVLVTGASSGIGLATALHFARRGYVVYAAMRTPEAAPDFEQAIAAEALAIRPLRLDVRDEAAVHAAVNATVAETGRLDVLVNNAGIGGPGAVEDTTIEIAREIFETNYFGTVHATRAALPHLRAAGRGTIVNISSISAEVALPGMAHYGASKAAVEAFSEALAAEVRQLGIRVIVVAPGVTRTPMFTRRKYLRPISPHSPYLNHLRRLLQYFAWRTETGSIAAEDVAHQIHAAVHDDLTTFRFHLGPDVRLPDSSTPETRMALGTALLDLADVEYRAAAAARRIRKAP